MTIFVLMKLSDKQKQYARQVALYSLLYPFAMLVAHRVRTGAFDWSDFWLSVFTAVVLGILFFLVGTYTPKKKDNSPKE